MKPYNIYLIEIITRISYTLFSFGLCWTIFFTSIETLFLFEISPVILFLTSKRFIITQITQLFSIVWLFCFTLSLFFIFPLVVWHTKHFFISSWYKYQFKLYQILVIYFLQMFSFLYFFTHLFLVPHIVAFFLNWEVIDEYSLLRIESEIILSSYISWFSVLKFLLSFSISNIFSIFIILLYFLDVKLLYRIILNYKKVFVFSFICFLLFLIPPDFLLQVSLLLLLFYLVEVLLYLICIKLYIKIKI